MIKAQTVAIAAVMAIYIISVAMAAPVSIDKDVRERMVSAVFRGQAIFGGAVARTRKSKPSTLHEGQESPVKKEPTKTHSIYSSPYTSLGGGKPNRNDKYQKHSYVPYAPKVTPWNNGEKYHSEFISPEESKQRFVPHHVYQFSSDEDLH